MENGKVVNGKEIMRANATKNAEQVADEKDEEDVQAGIAKEVDRIKNNNARKSAVRAANQEDEDVQATRIVDRADERNRENEKGARIVDRIDEEDEEGAVDRTAERIDEEESLRRRERKMKGINYTNVMVQTVVQEEEKTKRESEVAFRIREKRHHIVVHFHQLPFLRLLVIVSNK